MYHLKFATPNITLSGLGWNSRSSSYLLWRHLFIFDYIAVAEHMDIMMMWLPGHCLLTLHLMILWQVLWWCCLPAWPVHYYYSISNIINNLNDSPDQWSCTETVHMSPGVYIQFTVQVSNYYQWLWYCVLRLSYFFVCILVSSTWYFIQT